MLIKIKDANINFAYNSDYVFHDLKAKNNIILYDELEETLNDKKNKIQIAESFCGAYMFNEEIHYLSFSELIAEKNKYYFNIVNAYDSLINISESGIYYKNMLIKYNDTFTVSGDSPIENKRNVVYNSIVASIIFDYKKQNK